MTPDNALQHAHDELHSARAADDAAIRIALQKGLMATQPLTIARLNELCALGEEMIRTGRRRKAAFARMASLRAVHTAGSDPHLGA